MTDEWRFRTATGRATVEDGRLRITGSVRRMLRNRWREGWVENDAGRRVLFVVSVLTTAAFLPRAVASARAALAGQLRPMNLLVLAAFGFAVLAVAWKVFRVRSVPLRDVESVRRADDDLLLVAYDDGDETTELELRTLTDDEADEAVEMLRLKGVTVAE